MQFKEITGLETVKQQLIGGHKKGKTAHAQLFLGREGSGALGMALSYATYLHCEDKQGDDSCGVCPSCIKMSKLVHPDTHFLYPSTASLKSSEDTADPLIDSWRQFATSGIYGNITSWAFQAGLENKQLSISADPMRAMMKRISLKAFESDYKIVIVWLAEYMNSTAANAVLKVLEEPSEGTVFLLVSNDLNKILTTIKSRCQLVNIPLFTDEDVQSFLSKQYSGVDTDLIDTTVRQAEGNLNFAINKLTGESTDFMIFFRNWMRMCYASKYAELVQLSEEFQQMGKIAQHGLIDFGLFILRRSMLHLNNIEQAIGHESSFVQGFSKTLNENIILHFTQLLNETAYHLERNASPKICFLNLSINLSKVFKLK